MRLTPTCEPPRRPRPWRDDLPMIAEAAALALRALPAAMTMVNLATLGAPPPSTGALGVSVLIPARDEEANIEACLRAALASRHVDLEVVVLDDGSADRTAAIVKAVATEDPRVRLAAAPPLPSGWNGKQHACQVLSTLATKDFLVFIDADVRLEPSGVASLVQGLGHEPGGADLVSGVPRQVMVTVPERLLVPMINTLIFGYLPVPLMRRRPDIGLGAGCGQLMAVDAAAYRVSGGHAAIRTSLHDGLKLPRLFRAAGLRTNLVDGTGLAHCRMYADAGSLLEGLLKNANEGLARPIALPVWTVLLLGGHVLPWSLLVAAAMRGDRLPTLLAGMACLLSLGARALQARRCREPGISVPLHPLGVASLVAVQWLALARQARRRPKTWRGRTYGSGVA